VKFFHINGSAPVVVEERLCNTQFSVALLNIPSSRHLSLGGAQFWKSSQKERTLPAHGFYYPTTFSSRNFYSISPQWFIM